MTTFWDTIGCLGRSHSELGKFQANLAQQQAMQQKDSRPNPVQLAFYKQHAISNQQITWFQLASHEAQQARKRELWKQQHAMTSGVYKHWMKGDMISGEPVAKFAHYSIPNKSFYEKLKDEINEWLKL